VSIIAVGIPFPLYAYTHLKLWASIDIHNGRVLGTWCGSLGWIDDPVDLLPNGSIEGEELVRWEAFYASGCNGYCKGNATV